MQDQSYCMDVEADLSLCWYTCNLIGNAVPRVKIYFCNFYVKNLDKQDWEDSVDPDHMLQSVTRCLIRVCTVCHISSSF